MGQEEEAVIVEETQADLENQVEFLTDLKNEIGEMIDTEVEKAREAGHELNTVDDVIRMREEQGYKDEDGFFATYKKHLEELQKNKKPEPPKNKHDAHRAKHGASRRRADKDRHYEEKCHLRERDAN